MAIVSARRIPAAVRHTLNIESGLNDGLALPFVLFFLVLATHADNPGLEAAKLVGEAGVGVALGVGIAFAAGYLLHRLPGPGLAAKYKGIYALAIALLAFGLAEVTWGNGLISVFVAGIALALARHDIPESFAEFNESVSATFQVITFFVFGALVVATGWHGETWNLVAFVAFALVVARPGAVLEAFLGVGLPRSQKLSIGLVRAEGRGLDAVRAARAHVERRDRTLVFDIASFTVLARSWHRPDRRGRRPLARPPIPQPSQISTTYASR